MPENTRTSASGAATEVGGFMRIASVVRFTGLGRTTIYWLMDQRCFPSAVRLGPRAVGWLATSRPGAMEHREARHRWLKLLRASAVLYAQPRFRTSIHHSTSLRTALALELRQKVSQASDS